MLGRARPDSGATQELPAAHPVQLECMGPRQASPRPVAPGHAVQGSSALAAHRHARCALRDCTARRLAFPPLPVLGLAFRGGMGIPGPRVATAQVRAQLASCVQQAPPSRPPSRALRASGAPPGLLHAALAPPGTTASLAPRPPSRSRAGQGHLPGRGRPPVTTAALGHSLLGALQPARLAPSESFLVAWEPQLAWTALPTPPLLST